MKIGIISDTHDKLPAIESALAYFHSQHVAMIVHCGDWKSLDTMKHFAVLAAKLSLPVRGVLGNNDIETHAFMQYAADAPGDFAIEALEMRLTVQDVSIAIHHGHHKPTLRNIIVDEQADIVLLGHTHKPKIEMIQNKLVINPGSTAFAIPRSKTWVASVVVLEVNSKSATIHYL